METKWTIVQYSGNYESEWDDFVEKKAINGSFLQERRFLNYHPKSRFCDASLLFYYKDMLEAVCPACMLEEGGEKIFYSHKGSTYGGLVVSKKIYRAELIFELIDYLEKYLKENGYTKCILKPTMNLLSRPSMDLMEFCLFYRGYKEYKEISTFINYQNYNQEVIYNLSQMKQRLVKKNIKAGVVFREFEEDNDILEFHDVLTGNLKKFNTKPVHSREELLDLKHNRISKELKFYGAYLDEKLISGTMVFEFEKYKCAHTQYLAADLAYNKLSPMSFVYYKVAELYMKKGYDYLSWGIATEDRGAKINMGLLKNKEEFGSEHIVVKSYEKQFNK